MRKLISSMLITVMILGCILPVTASQLSDARNKKNNIDNKIDEISKKKKQISKQIQSKVQEKKYVESVKREQEKQEKQKKEEIAQAVKEVEAIETAIKSSEEDYEQKQELFKTRLKVMYETANTSFLETLLESKSIDDFFSRLEFLSLIKKQDGELLESLYSSKMDMEYKKTTMLDKKIEKESQANALKQKINSLEDKVSRAKEELEQYDSMQKQLEKQEDDLLRRSEEISSMIRGLEKKGTRYAGGSMAWPLPCSAQITSYYGMRYHPILKKRKMHTGVDIAASTGSSIVAANSGTVIVASWQGAYGNAVFIDHGGGIVTLYAHCSKLLVGVGERVKKGQVIAKVGSTGNSTGPHLHFEVREHGSTLNPLDGYISQ